MADNDEPTQTTDEPVEASIPQSPSHRPPAPLQYRDPDRYEILGEHGRGGLGIVSRAHDRELGRDVAIKGLLSRGGVGEIRFLREALITARLEHPGIVPIHEAGRWPDGTPFYVMKLIAGRSLKELLAERTTVEARLELLHHVIAVADAVAYAHQRRIIHRDLKASNVIAGDFGETVVIDWGLAKDLRTTAEVGPGQDPFRTAPVDDLTAACGPIGTLMYMPPEQRRGDPVDQRADVFAIGMMVWQLCSLEPTPPADPRERDRALRRARIDKDLVAILAKALAPAPEDRYLDAGELAADLKAFQSGVRITARQYSLLAVLAHWIRRHRTLAATAIVMIALAVIGSVLFVVNIATERDRADAARTVAEQANDELVLQNAELLLQRDPTAAADALAGYHGKDGVRQHMLLAEATGRGIAAARFAPHSNTIWFLAGDASGAIFSLSQDRQIRVTKDNRSRTLTADLAATGTHAYAPARGLLVYARSPAGIAAIDLKTQRIQPITAIEVSAPAEMAITPDGSRLAVLDSGKLTIWELSADLAAHKLFEESLPDGVEVFFADPAHLIVRAEAGLRAISLAPRQTTPTRPAPGLTRMDVRGAYIALGDELGNITLLSRELSTIATIRACHKRVNNAQFAERAPMIAFACEDNTAGIIEYDEPRTSMTVKETFSTSEAALDAKPDALGAHVVVMTDSSIVYAHDTQSHLTTRYEGHVGRVSFIAAPTAEFERVLVGNVNGMVRVWDVPSHAARVALRAGTMIFGAAFSWDDRSIITDGRDGVVRHITIDNGVVTELKGHQGAVVRTLTPADGRSFLSYGVDGTLRTWDPTTHTVLRTFSEHVTVNEAGYIEGGRRIASVGDDGRLLAWSPRGADSSLLFRHPDRLPLRKLASLASQPSIIVSDSVGALWSVTLHGEARQVRKADGDAITLLRASPDGSLLAIGSSTNTGGGVVTVYRTSDYEISNTITLAASVRQIQFDPHNRDLLIASEDGHVRAVALSRSRIPWVDLGISARNAAYSADGELLAFVCWDGGTWFYSSSEDRWIYTRDHATDISSGRFSHDGATFVSTDRNGAVVLRDMNRTFAHRSR